MRMAAWAAAALAAALCACGPGEPADDEARLPDAQDLPAAAYQRAVLACLDGARDHAEGDPTDFPCDWELINEAALSGSLTGRYALDRAGADGVLVVLEPPSGAPYVALQTVNEEALSFCTLSGDAIREGQSLRYRSMDALACTVRFTMTDEGVAVSSEGDCSYYCGARGVLDGTYAAALP